MQQAEAGRYLAAQNIRPSYQRVCILQYLLERRSHPTVDEIYQALVREIPGLSRTTVYNTLGLFIHRKIAQPLTIEENQTRYDADVSEHGHFQCRRCGRVYDFSLDRLALSGLEGFAVESRQVYLKGICPACRESGEPDENK